MPSVSNLQSTSRLPTVILAASILLTFVPGNGYWLGLFAVVAAIALLVVRRQAVTVEPGLVALWALMQIAQLFGDPSLALGPLWSERLFALVLAAFFLIGFLGFRMVVRKDKSRPVVVGYRALLLGMLASLGLVAIVGVPVMHDVQQYHEQAAERLLAGQPLNGYMWADNATIDQPYVIEGPFVASSNYPYMPLEAVLRTPFHVLGDVRLAGLAALLVTYPITVALARQHGFAGAVPDVVATIVVAGGAPLFILQQAWTEPLVLPFLTGGLLLHARGNRVAAGILLGLAAASKLWLLIFLPVAWAADRRTGVIAAGTAAATVLPFLLANPVAFVDGVLLFHLAQPPRLDGITLVRALPWWPTVNGAVAWVVGALVIVARRPAMADGLRMATVSLALLFLLGAQANANYWWLLQHMLILAAITCPVEVVAQDRSESDFDNARSPKTALAPFGAEVNAAHPEDA